nr:PREDICTED: uncharacterized protein LOC109029903 [Bemisia tabaci]
MLGYQFYHFSCWYYFPVYHLSKLTGVLHVGIDRKALQKSNDTKQKKLPIFKISITSWLVFCVWAVLNAKVVDHVSDMTRTGMQKYNSCFDEVCSESVCRSACAHYAIAWVAETHCALSLLLGLLYRPAKLRKLLNDLYHQATLARVTFPVQICVSTFVLLGIHACTFWMQWQRNNYGVGFLHRFGYAYIAMITPIIHETFIAALVTCVEVLFKNFNAQIDRLCALDSVAVFQEDMSSKIEALTHRHWKITKLAVDLNRCYTIDFLISTLNFVLRTIYFCFLNLKFLVSAPKHKRSINVPKPMTIIFFLSVVAKYIWVCYRCDLACMEMNETLNHVRRLLLRKELKYNRTAYKTTKRFIYQINSRPVAFTACRLFSIDRNLLKKICGVTTTYFIILLQFQSSADS